MEFNRQYIINTKYMVVVATMTGMLVAATALRVTTYSLERRRVMKRAKPVHTTLECTNGEMESVDGLLN